jgi:aspartate oxidase
MDTHVGILRTAEGLAEAHAWLCARAEHDSVCRVGAAIAGAALAREESVGCHRRAEFPVAVAAR